MQQAEIQAKTQRRWRVTTQSGHDHVVASNRLNRQFQVSSPYRVWAGDMTYLWSNEGWVYLAVVLDLYSRAVIGWAMSPRIDTQLTMLALRMAITSRRPCVGALYHSDRGVQYANDRYQAELAASQIDSSMSRIGNCWDNAVVESFFATLKKELIHHHRYATRA
jgi:putative transposase